MSEKVLVADDSLTIQKVVGITLANSSMELTQALNENELLETIKSDQFDLLLLDFNLSEGLSGYELAKEVKKISNIPILAMLGTFDSVEESELRSSGISDKIVKPFESDKFIQKCRSLIEENTDYEVDNEITEVEEVTMAEEVSDVAEGWVVDSPRPEDHSEDIVEDVVEEDSSVNALADEMMGWGMEVPGVINAENNFAEFPPVIEKEALPAGSDLDYPDDVGSVSEDLESVKLSSSLVSMNDLSDEFEEEEDIEAQVEQELNTSDIALQEEVDSDITPDELWAVDVNDSHQDEEADSSEVEARSFQVVETLPDSGNYIEEAPVEEEMTTLDLEIDQDEMVASIKESITPMIQEMVEKFCKQKIEQIAWEVIPDLAENLIKKEIKEISKTIR